MYRNEFSCLSWWDVVSGHSSNGTCTQILPRVFRVRERPVYLREALLSRINPIHGRIPLPLLLLALRRWLSLPQSDFSIPSRSPLRLRQGLSCSCARIYHKLSFLRVPSTDISEQFVSKQLIILQQIHFLLLQNDGHPSMASRLFTTAQSIYLQIRNIFPHISLIDLPHHWTMKISFRHQVSPWLFLFVSGNFSLAQGDILDSNILL